MPSLVESRSAGGASGCCYLRGCGSVGTTAVSGMGNPEPSVRLLDACTWAYVYISFGTTLFSKICSRRARTVSGTAGPIASVPNVIAASQRPQNTALDQHLVIVVDGDLNPMRIVVRASTHVARRSRICYNPVVYCNIYICLGGRAGNINVTQWMQSGVTRWKVPVHYLRRDYVSVVGTLRMW